jgi:hypothetical protein
LPPETQQADGGIRVELVRQHGKQIRLRIELSEFDGPQPRFQQQGSVAPQGQQPGQTIAMAGVRQGAGVGFEGEFGSYKWHRNGIGPKVSHHDSRS